MILRINEILHTLQGEGANAGCAAVFVRLSDCNLKCSFCDTVFDEQFGCTPEELWQRISIYPTRFLIWTGGEPTLQLTTEVVSFFRECGYRQAIETNGTRPMPVGLDYVTCSPKPEAMKLLHRNFPNGVDEFRFPISADGALPPSVTELPKARNYMVSPIFVGESCKKMDKLAVKRCIRFVLEHPEWRLSIQMHKLLGFD